MAAQHCRFNFGSEPFRYVGFALALAGARWLAMCVVVVFIRSFLMAVRSCLSRRFGPPPGYQVFNDHGTLTEEEKV